MTVNIFKTKAVVLSSAQRQSQLQDNAPTIRIGDDQIQLCNKGKLLGVIVDTSLNGSAQVEATLKKCNSLLYLLGRIKTFLNLSTCKLYFSAYILPHLDYCLTIWGNCNNYLLDETHQISKTGSQINFG